MAQIRAQARDASPRESLANGVTASSAAFSGQLKNHLAASVNILQFSWTTAPGRLGTLRSLMATGLPDPAIGSSPTLARLPLVWPAVSLMALAIVVPVAPGGAFQSVNLDTVTSFNAKLRHLPMGDQESITDSVTGTSDYLIAASGTTKGLIRAVKKGDVKAVESLIADGADVHYADKNGWTPLHLAAKRGNYKIVGLLLDAGAKVFDSRLTKTVNQVDEKCWNPINLAFYYKHVTLRELMINKVAAQLIDSGSDIDTIKDCYGENILHYASRDGHENVAEFLIYSGANVEIKSNNGLTPLHYASVNGHQNLAELLVNSGANVEITTNNDWTPLHYASRYGHGNIAMLLINSGANVEVITNDGWTPLHYASRYGHGNIAMLLINSGANVNLLTSENFNSVDLAYKGGYFNLEQKLAQLAGPSHARKADELQRQVEIQEAQLARERELIELARQQAEVQRQQAKAQQIENQEKYRPYLAYMRNCMIFDSSYSDKDLIDYIIRLKSENLYNKDYSIPYGIRSCYDEYMGY